MPIETGFIITEQPQLAFEMHNTNVTTVAPIEIQHDISSIAPDLSEINKSTEIRNKLETDSQVFNLSEEDSKKSIDQNQPVNPVLHIDPIQVDDIFHIESSKDSNTEAKPENSKDSVSVAIASSAKLVVKSVGDTSETQPTEVADVKANSSNQKKTSKIPKKVSSATTSSSQKQKENPKKKKS